jgi:hypothetical protein
LYTEYLSWKDHVLRQEFLQLTAYQEIHPICRLCMRLMADSDIVLDEKR